MYKYRIHIYKFDNINTSLLTLMVKTCDLARFYSLVYYKIRHEAKTAYSQNAIKSLKAYNIIKSDELHKT